MRRSSWVLATALAVFGSQVRAEPLGIVSEVKFGVLAHDVNIVAADTFEDGVDFNGEVIFTPLGFLEPKVKLRPHVGVQINSTGDTSQVYAGLTATLFRHDRFWLAFSGGGTVHNGETSRTGRSRKAFGSSVLFRLALEAGVDVTEHVNVSLYFDHESNAFLADRNPGIDNVGMRVGWRF